MNAVYVPFRVPREHLAQFLDDAPALGIRGLSVTIPHKEAVLQAADRSGRGDQGHRRGQHDGLRRRQDRSATTPTTTRRWTAWNKPMQRDRATSSLEGQTALVLGAGGAARAIAFGLKTTRRERGRSAGRTLRAGRAAGRTARAAAPSTGTCAIGVAADILVNCTPVGMHPNVDATPYDKHHLKPSMVVFDTVYNPENTLLIKDARSAELHDDHRRRDVRPPGVLAVQAFTGQDAPADLMRDVLKRPIGPAKTLCMNCSHRLSRHGQEHGGPAAGAAAGCDWVDADVESSCGRANRSPPSLPMTASPRFATRSRGARRAG